MERLLTMNKFRLHKIYMNNYKLFDNKNIEFKSADLIVLDGPNGYGKTSIFEAIEYILTGNIKRAEQCPEVSGKISYDTHFMAKNAEKVVEIRGEFVSTEGILKIQRSIDAQNISGVQNNPKNLRNVTKTTIFLNDKIVYEGKTDKDADDIIEQYLGKNLITYYDSFYYISQEDRLKFLSAPEPKRMEQINTLFNIEKEINEYTDFSKFKTKLVKKIKALQSECEQKRKEYNDYKEKYGSNQENSIEKRKYKDLFYKCSKKPYWNEKIVRVKDKNKLEEILVELKKTALFSRNLDDFILSYNNFKFKSYVEDLESLKKLFVFDIWQNDIEENNKKYKKFMYLSLLPLKENEEVVDVEKIDFKTLKEQLEIDEEVDSLVLIQNEIFEARKKQTTYSKSLEKFKTARDNLNKSFLQWTQDGGTIIGKNVYCPYCGNDYTSQNEYAAAVKEMAETLGKCNDLESEKINQGLEKLQVEYNKRFKDIIEGFLNSYGYMKNDIIKHIVEKNSFISDEYNQFIDFLTKQHIDIHQYSIQLNKEDDWEIKIQEFIQMINDNYIKKVPIEYLQMENANGFFDIFKSIFEAKIENICIISEDDENDKRLYLEEQYQLQEYEKLEDMKKQLEMKEERVTELVAMKNDVEKVVTIYKNKIGKYQKDIIGEIQIPLYIYAGRVLQYYQGGLGIFIKCDSKKEKLDSIRFLSANQPDHDILYTLSSGQLTGVIIALTLTLNKIYGSEKFPCILIDDPVQTMDDLNIASLVELMRNEFRDYQMIISTHEEDFSRFIRYKYEKYNLQPLRLQLNEGSVR